MALHTVIIPKQGAYTEDLLLSDWLVGEGADVRAGDTLFTMESDKATTDIDAEVGGFLHQLIEAGVSVPIGTEVAVIADTREEYDELTAGSRDTSDGSTFPGFGHDGEPADPPHPFLTYLEDGGAAARVGGRDETLASTVPSRGSRRAPKPGADHTTGVTISPRARALLRANGLTAADIASLRGTGPAGRILERDVTAHLAQPLAAPAVPTPPADEVPEPGGVIERIPLSGVRGAIARRMLASLQTSAQLTSIIELDVSPVLELRKRLATSAGQPPVGLTAIFVHLAAQALREHPHLNARVTDTWIEVLADINIGVAVETQDGVLVPVIRDVAKLSLHEISGQLTSLASRARAGSLGVADAGGATFTVSNGGIHPVDMTTAILDPSHVALLWLGQIRDRPIVDENGAIVARPTLYACLTYDHRAVDGGPAAAFLGTLQRRVQSLKDYQSETVSG